MQRALRTLGLVSVVALSSWVMGVSSVFSGEVCPPDPQYHVDFVEHWTGATNINGTVGNGGLSAGVSQWGELTVLRWPSPSYYDQLNYETANIWPGYLCGTRMTQAAPGTYGLYRRPVVTAPNMGTFAGLYYFTATTPAGALLWLQDPYWALDQSYLTEDSNVLVTRFTHTGLGLRATQYDFVLPDQDVLVRHYLLERLPGSPVTSATFIFYENLAPNLTKTVGNPVFTGDAGNDFAVAYDARRDALLHFLPQKKDFSLLTPLLTQPAVSPSDVNAFIDGLQGEGVYIAVGADTPSGGHQCGEDDYTSCPVSMGWTSLPQGAFTNITTTGGHLSGSSIAGCQSDAALSFPTAFDELGSAEFTVYLTFSGTASAALSLLDDARTRPYRNHLAATENYWKTWLSTAALPKAADPQVIRFSKRALISIKVGQDRSSGATVASISLQPNYAEDWTRDGSFNNLALDMAGYHDLVTRHNLFYARVQRKRAVEGGPAGSWSSNYYADGTLGMILPSFEIDETGLAVWTLVNHAKFLDDPCKRHEYLTKVYPAVRLAAELLTTCKDPTNNLQCPANENDNPAYTQTLYGATTTCLGLVSAVEAGLVMGEKRTVLERWEARADELKEAILSSYDPSQTRFVTSPDVSGPYWLIWPGRVLPYSDPRLQAQAGHLYSDDLLPALQMKTPGLIYINEVATALALARAWQGNRSMRDKILDAVRIFVHNVPTKGTDHMGEVEIVEDLDGDGVLEFQNRVATPETSKQSINYLLAMAVFNPEAFDPVESPLKKGACLKDRGWGCSGPVVTQRSAIRMAAILIPLFLIIVLKKKR